MSDQTVSGALQVPARRGVAVEVVMTRQSEWASAFDALARAGVAVRTYSYSAPPLHSRQGDRRRPRPGARRVCSSARRTSRSPRCSTTASWASSPRSPAIVARDRGRSSAPTAPARHLGARRSLRAHPATATVQECLHWGNTFDTSTESRVVTRNAAKMSEPTPERRAGLLMPATRPATRSAAQPSPLSRHPPSRSRLGPASASRSAQRPPRSSPPETACAPFCAAATCRSAPCSTSC